MRVALLICLCFALAVAAGAQPADLTPLSAQFPTDRGPDVTVHEETVVDALRQIAQQSGINIAFETTVVERTAAKVVRIDNLPAFDAVTAVLDNTDLQAFVSSRGDLVVMAAVMDSEPRRIPGQTIRGRVVDQATRSPLIGANVVLVGTDPLIGTTTDVDGRFVLPNVPLGRQDIRVSYIGYEPAGIDEVLVTASKEVVLEVELREQILQGREVVIVPTTQKDAPQNEMALISARSFSVEETRRYAGGLDDPARMASSFAGIATGAGIQENAIIVRGNAPKGVLWRLEGVEIPNPNHFAGLTVMGAGGLTLFSSQLLADSDFLTSAFPAEYGNALAGVFDMQFRSGNSSAREHAFQVGVIGIDAASEGPFVHGQPSTYLFNYRYSTLGLIMPLLPTEDVAQFQDLSFKLSFPTKRAGRFEVWGIGGLDAQTMSAELDSSKWEYETWDLYESDLHLGVGAGGVSHGIVLGNRSYLRSTAAITANRTLFERDRLTDDLALAENLLVDNLSGRMIVGSYLNHKFGSRHVNRTGFSLQQLFYDVRVEAAIDDRPPVVPIAVGRGGASLVRAYTQSQVDLSTALSLNAGVHLQHFSLSGQTSVEPRISARWSLGDGKALSAGYGLHSQIEDLRIYFASRDGRTPNRDLPFARAHHGVLGYDQPLGPNSRVKIEGYYQYLFDVAVISDSSYSLINFEQDFVFNDVLTASGAGENYGVELTLERFLEDGLYFLITGSVFESSYRGGDDVWRPTRWDRGYTANGLVGKEVELGSPRNLLGLNARVSVVGGKRRSPVDYAASLAREEVVFNAYRAFADREPALFLLDLTVTYRRNRGSVSDVWALQLKNALAAKETILDYNHRSNTVQEVREGFPLPVLSYKIEF